MGEKYTTDEERPIFTVDAIIMTIHEDKLKVLLNRRDKDPFHGSLALPGGYAHLDEDHCAEDAVYRVLSEKTGLKDIYFEQMKTYSGSLRDPRGWSVSLAFMALVPYADIDLESLSSKACFLATDEIYNLAFDHNTILQDAIQRLRGKGSYSSLPAEMLGAEFTLFELRKAYEAVLEKTINASAFRRKITAIDAFEKTGEVFRGGARPAEKYRLKFHATFNRDFGGA